MQQYYGILYSRTKDLKNYPNHYWLLKSIFTPSKQNAFHSQILLSDVFFFYSNVMNTSLLGLRIFFVYKNPYIHTFYGSIILSQDNRMWNKSSTYKNIQKCTELYIANYFTHFIYSLRGHYYSPIHDSSFKVSMQHILNTPRLYLATDNCIELQATIRSKENSYIIWLCQSGAF
jgi:hypothetical protein